MRNTSIKQLFYPFAFLTRAIIDLVYPPLCLLCEERLAEDQEQICQPCLSSFVLLGKPHTEFSVPHELYIHQAWALFDFDENVKNLIHHLKYSQRRKPILRLLDHFEKSILKQLPSEPYDLVLPIPLHPRKLRERGYNQVEDMARWLASRMGARVDQKIVVRSRYTQTQTKLNALERQKNLAGAFRIQGSPDLHNKRILLVDDVLTTGATSNTLAQVLEEQGCSQIDLLTLSTPRLSHA
jgi:ComF family protein